MNRKIAGEMIKLLGDAIKSLIEQIRVFLVILFAMSVIVGIPFAIMTFISNTYGNNVALAIPIVLIVGMILFTFVVLIKDWYLTAKRNAEK